MTGKDLIVYILQNNLENEDIPGFMTKEEVAAKYEVGVATVETWYKFGFIKGVGREDNVYFFLNVPDPTK